MNWFSDVFALIGSAWVPYIRICGDIPIWKWLPVSTIQGVADSAYQRYGESPTPRIVDTGNRYLRVKYALVHVDYTHTSVVQTRPDSAQVFVADTSRSSTLLCSADTSRCSSGRCCLDTSRSNTLLCSADTSRCSSGPCSVDTSRNCTGLYSANDKVIEAKASKMMFFSISTRSEHVR
jgi:hypothetical protein